MWDFKNAAFAGWTKTAYFALLSLTMPVLWTLTGFAQEEQGILTHSSVLEMQQQIDELKNAADVRTAVKYLVALDGELEEFDIESRKSLQMGILISLAHHGTPTAVQHLRAVFETQTLRRHDAAYAISLVALKRPANDQDWRYLVRSLTIVEDEQAASVLKALCKFRRRATRAIWVREVILMGLQLPDEQLPHALELLKLWSGQVVNEEIPVRDQLRYFQAWFHAEYPDQPTATLPADSPATRWHFESLSKVIVSLPNDSESLTAGAAAYLKANCNKCHRRQGIAQQPADDRLGPNLTSLGWRRQPKEVISAVLYPSHRLNDEYPVTTVVLKSGKTTSGLLMPTKDGELKVVGADSKETVFAKDDVEETVMPNISNMPAGLLESLSEDEVRDLFAFLTVQSGEYDPHRR